MGTRGNAALAALFDEVEQEEAARDEAIETDFTEVTRPVSDEAINEALASPAIARLVSQQTGSSPRAEEPVLVDDGQETSPGLLRRAARMVVSLGDGMATMLEGIASRAGARNAQPEPSTVTPGDRKVTEWRMEQIRRARRRMTPAKATGWAALVACAGVLAYAGVFHHRDIVAVWPRAEAAYATAGLGEGAPVSLSGVGHRYALSQRGAVVEMFGTLRHEGVEALRTPLIEVRALSADGRLLAHWAFAPEGPGRMSPQSDLPFRSRALAPAGTAAIRLSLMSETDRAGLDASLPEAAASLNRDGAGGFFMQKTTSGWGQSQTALPGQVKDGQTTEGSAQGETAERGQRRIRE